MIHRPPTYKKNGEVKEEGTNPPKPCKYAQDLLNRMEGQLQLVGDQGMTMDKRKALRAQLWRIANIVNQFSVFDPDTQTIQPAGWKPKNT